MQWFADRKALEAKQAQERLRHYHYRVLAKRFGQVRLIEAPKPRLKEIQRRVLTGIVEHIPVHAAAPWSGAADLSPPLPRHTWDKTWCCGSICRTSFHRSASLASGLFQSVGYIDDVASFLAGLCTNTTPTDVWDENLPLPDDVPHRSVRFLYAIPHLPQGRAHLADTGEPVRYRLDCRLAGLAAAAGATYTRYADDLAFSGGPKLHRSARRFCLHVAATAMEEGFAVHHRKTRIMRQGVRQHLAGLAVNERLNVTRTDYDHLKATLTNCVRHGPSSQNLARHNDFCAHLLGRVSFVAMVNAARGQRLQKLFDQIAW